ncbi:hypothetical protein DPMN_054660 [Dreissena polymorpha]|uniref:Uncharacterized protein n=1 Tax=Dreissena polymorpha TaxID=45954 RepID=A0A9D4CNI7_DREPO|nr:hypothetical protein DPMN_054660 [Dreissena polymorpha]
MTVEKSTVLLMESITISRSGECHALTNESQFGRPVKVNNFLTTLNITLIANRNLLKMEARAGEAIKKISTASSNKAAIDVYEKEMELLLCI